MNVLVVLAHPQKGSFNHAIAETVISTLNQQGHKIIDHDLYAENFNPIINAEECLPNAELDDELQRHCKELCSAEGIVIIHPNWWGQPPAILKGWIDRVFRAKTAYRFEETEKGEGVPVGLLKAKKAIVFNTSNTKEEREQNTFGDPLDTLWKNCIFGLCGIRNVKRKMFSVIITSTQQQRETWLKEVAVTIAEQFPKK